ncbi:MAG: poly-gamma-glutamate synthase PgsB [Myxococcales bacterium]|nr:poly-gamma-glutamate synthase PgsB [Myxococcales bacterium]MDH5306104.1 poly-gamma-glutamate synthase PgsB [Myxococcales bacterium]MDH5565434.1 poly-gamma-glutamate synthase PgsB [Myxococcales bacterium]
MTLILGLSLLVLFLIGLGLVEYAVHRRNLASIPIRIHVNGTRGKSSVVRLVAAALRAHGIVVYAKTTGSLARMIAADGTEFTIHRPGLTNVIEQRRIIGVAAAERAEAIVLECMALQPKLQSLCELKLIRSTHGVICNARPDHLEVMGPTERDVALALLGTCPVNGTLFTAEREHLPLFEEACRDRGSKLVALGPEQADEISDEEMERFAYIEHKDNVALALAVARDLGIPRHVALNGMLHARPDVGALREIELEFFGRRVVFVNGFAANDPVSTERIWNLTLARNPQARTRILVINCRLDRPDRSRQLGEVLPSWAPAHHYLLVGTGTYALARTAVAAGLRPTLLTPLEGESSPAVFEEILGACGRNSLVMGAGNIAGVGLDLLKFFQNRATPRAEGEADAA